MGRKILVPAFVLMCLVQLYVPMKMVLDSKDILESGAVYKFKTVPVDPTDPLRGKYIALSYAEQQFEVDNEKEWTTGEAIKVYPAVDEMGFAYIASISKTARPSNDAFFDATIDYISNDGSNIARIRFPFDRYYLEESKAEEAEKLYRKLMIEGRQDTYALVMIKGGAALLKNVMVDEVPITQLIDEQRDQN